MCPIAHAPHHPCPPSRSIHYYGSIIPLSMCPIAHVAYCPCAPEGSCCIAHMPHHSCSSSPMCPITYPLCSCAPLLMWPWTLSPMSSIQIYALLWQCAPSPMCPIVHVPHCSCAPPPKVPHLYLQY